MKRLLLAFILSSGLFMASNAQQQATAAVGSPAPAKAAKRSTGITKSGKPDMRLKANKDAVKVAAQPVMPAPVAVAKVPAAAPRTKTVPAKVAATPASAPAIAPAPAPTPAGRSVAVQKTAPATASADAAIGTDAKGRTIYGGKRGGTYYINKNGNKEYIKQ